MQPLISVIIPVYNRPKELALSLESIYRQTYRPLEVVIVDDGSEPVMHLPESKSFSDGISILLVRQKNKGAPAARNHGFTKSKGEFVLFWDSDTIGHPEMIEKMYKVLQQKKNISYVYCQYKLGWKKMKSSPFDEDLLFRYNYIDTTSLLRREDFFGFDESLRRSQDWDLWLTLCEKNKKGYFLSEVLFKKLLTHQDSISHWIPKFLYRFFLKPKKARDYFESRNVIAQKHHLKDF